MGVSECFLFNRDLGIFDDNVILVAVPEIFVDGQRALNQNCIADLGSHIGGHGQVMGAGSLVAASVLNMQPVFTHDLGAVLDNLAAQSDFLAGEVCLVAVNFTNRQATLCFGNVAQVNIR